MFGAISDDSGEDDEYDDDSVMLPFLPLSNAEALKFFVNNEINNSAKIVDYFSQGSLDNGELKHNCLLVAIYAHHIYLTQPNNFNRVMGQNEWLTNPIKRKLLDIKEDLDKKFGENLNGRGH